MSEMREVCRCGHAKASHHEEKVVERSGPGDEPTERRVPRLCLAAWCDCRYYVADR